jgi:hypothetical protein
MFANGTLRFIKFDLCANGKELDDAEYEFKAVKERNIKQ